MDLFRQQGWDSRVKKASKVSVEPLISADELIAESESMHEATLLQPEDAAEAAMPQSHVRWVFHTEQ